MVHEMPAVNLMNVRFFQCLEQSSKHLFQGHSFRYTPVCLFASWERLIK